MEIESGSSHDVQVFTVALQNIDHPGVVNLEFVHESPDKV